MQGFFASSLLRGSPRILCVSGGSGGQSPPEPPDTPDPLEAAAKGSGKKLHSGLTLGERMYV